MAFREECTTHRSEAPRVARPEAVDLARTNTSRFHRLPGLAKMVTSGAYCHLVFLEHAAELVDRLTRECSECSIGLRTKRVDSSEGEIDASTQALVRRSFRAVAFRTIGYSVRLSYGRSQKAASDARLPSATHLPRP